MDGNYRLQLFLRYGYLAALTLIAALAFSAFMLLTQLIETEKSSALLINVSGRQRMLSQRIVLIATQMLTTKESAAREKFSNELLENLNQFQQAHNNLLKGNEAEGFPSDLSKNVWDVYYESPINLDKTVKVFYQLVQDALSSSINNAGLENESYKSLVKLAKGPLLQKLNEAVSAFQIESDERITALHKLELIIFISTLVLLTLEALFIFRPLTKMTSRWMKRYEVTNAELNHFLYAASHDLKTPLHDMSNLSQWIADEAKEESVKSHAKDLLTRINYMSVLLQALKEYATFDRIKVITRVFNLETLVKGVFRDLYGEKSVPYELSCTKAEIKTDPVLLKYILSALIKNIQDHASNTNDSILIQCNERSTSYQFTVVDHGAGISKNSLEKLTNPFQRGDQAHYNRHAGLSLSMLRKIMGKTDGEFSITSDQGKGTVVTFSLPK